jgi:hypothetical protein
LLSIGGTDGTLMAPRTTPEEMSIEAISSRFPAAPIRCAISRSVALRPITTDLVNEAQAFAPWAGMTPRQRRH